MRIRRMNLANHNRIWSIRWPFQVLPRAIESLRNIWPQSDLWSDSVLIDCFKKPQIMVNLWVTPGIINLALGFGKIHTPLLFWHTHVHVVHDTFDFLVDTLNLTFDRGPVVGLVHSPVLSRDLASIAFLFASLFWCSHVWCWVVLADPFVICRPASKSRADFFSQSIELLVCLPFSACLSFPRLTDSYLCIH